tara:strand:- start:1 stop:198 length:198 start_codon:yes stop_codon:yes gene_type:complete
MALENNEVLTNLKEQLKTVSEQYEQLATTRLKILGAIDVLEQIEDSKEETSETGTVEVVENEGDE